MCNRSQIGNSQYELALCFLSDCGYGIQEHQILGHQSNSYENLTVTIGFKQKKFVKKSHEQPWLQLETFDALMWVALDKLDFDNMGSQ